MSAPARVVRERHRRAGAVASALDDRGRRRWLGNRDEIVEGSRRSAASGLRLVGIRFADTQLHAQGNVVVVFSNYTMELEQQGQRSTVTGSASEVFVRSDGVWQNPFWYLGPR